MRSSVCSDICCALPAATGKWSKYWRWFFIMMKLVLTAVTMALEAGVPTKTHILNLLYRLVDGKPISTPPVTAPQALKLVSEPVANVERYDDLRKEKRHAS